MSNRVIAIDGPSASGKSTVAKKVAAALGSLYVDSGALYRGITWKAVRDAVDTGDPDRLAALLKDFPIAFFTAEGAVRFKIDGIEPGLELRTEEINSHVSKVAATPAVRMQVNAWLRDMVRLGSLVVEGRDIGTAVFPDAAFKFYLNASQEERARRRHAEITERKNGVTKKEIGESLRRRDAIDSTRKMDPLKAAPGAIVRDSTSMQADEVAGIVLGKVKG